MLKIHSKSDIGLVRKTNEDSCSGGILPDGAAWAVVCDGMGGANGGNVASSIAVERISGKILSSYRENGDPDFIRELITSAIFSANEAVHEKAGTDAALSGMGTTVVVAIASSDVAYVAHAGDSRAYMLTAEGIRRLTTDHSVVQEMVDKGDLTEQEAKKHPQKNIITRALGVESSVRVDYSRHEFPQGSLLLICTDGLTNYIDEDQIFRISRECGADRLAERLVALAKDAGGGDNITVTVIEN